MRGGTRASFRTEFFKYHYNRPCHGLDDATLYATLDRFESLGWTTGRNWSTHWSKTDRTVELTDKGGELWEAERLPDWGRYVTDSGGGWICSMPTRHRVKIYGFSQRIVREFFDIGRSCGFFDLDVGPLRLAVATRPWIYWKPPRAVHLLSWWSESLAPPDGQDLAAVIAFGKRWQSMWEQLESMRTWWRFPHEIGKLWGLPRVG